MAVAVVAAAVVFVCQGYFRQTSFMDPSLQAAIFNFYLTNDSFAKTLRRMDCLAKALQTTGFVGFTCFTGPTADYGRVAGDPTIVSRRTSETSETNKTSFLQCFCKGIHPPSRLHRVVLDP